MTSNANDIKSEHLLLTKRGTAWLAQFEAADQSLAQKLVKGLTLVSHSFFERALTKLILQTAKNISGPVALYATRELEFTRTSYFQQAASKKFVKGTGEVDMVDAVGRGHDIGSEGRVASIITKIVRLHPEKFLDHPNVGKMRRQKCRAIMVVDDIIGSGTRTLSFLKCLWLDRTVRSWHSLKYMRFYSIAFSGTRMGLKKVQTFKGTPEVLFCRDCPTYLTLPWTKFLRAQIERLCSKYGKLTSNKAMSLGFKKTMAAIVFEHGCPNNVPAIFWAMPSAKSKWKPLFPDRSVSGEEASAFPPEIAKREAIATLIDAGQKKLAKSKIIRTPGVIDLDKLVTLALIAKGVRKEEAISFATGVDKEECRLLLKSCTELGLITPTLRITSLGRAELNYAKRLGTMRMDIPSKGNDVYYPKKLRRTTDG